MSSHHTCYRKHPVGPIVGHIQIVSDFKVMIAKYMFGMCETQGLDLAHIWALYGH